MTHQLQKLFLVVHRPTGVRRWVWAEDATAACRKHGWLNDGECFVKQVKPIEELDLVRRP